jgi:hypothetical protein
MVEVEVEAKFLRTYPDVTPFQLFKRTEKYEDDELVSHRSSLIGWTNQVNADIRKELLVAPPFDPYELISVVYLFELKDDFVTVFIEEPKITFTPRYLVREMTLCLRTPWFNRIIEWIKNHYK